MKINNLENLINYENKKVIKNIVIEQAILLDNNFLPIINTYPNINYLEFYTSNNYDDTLNDLINYFCECDIKEIIIRFKDSCIFKKSNDAYDYKNTRIKRIWNCLSFFSNNYEYNYDNLPSSINLLRIHTYGNLILTNLPIGLMRIEVGSQLINPILKIGQWKIPFDCELYYNNSKILLSSIN